MQYSSSTYSSSSKSSPGFDALNLGRTWFSLRSISGAGYTEPREGDGRKLSVSRLASPRTEPLKRSGEAEIGGHYPLGHSRGCRWRPLGVVCVCVCAFGRQIIICIPFCNSAADGVCSTVYIQLVPQVWIFLHSFLCLLRETLFFLCTLVCVCVWIVLCCYPRCGARRSWCVFPSPTR